MLQESGGEGLNIGIVGGGAIGLLLAAYLGRRMG
ncbi:hypothetical protein LR69_00407 [Geobacillus sp. BCO2]|nr:hypothetical protein LR69_00407 [Geobacillus sp. BCO2]